MNQWERDMWEDAMRVGLGMSDEEIDEVLGLGPYHASAAEKPELWQVVLALTMVFLCIVLTIGGL